jgi:hypothetical protein
MQLFPSSGLHLPEEGNSSFPNVACYIVTMEKVQMNINDKTHVKALSKMYMIQSLKVYSSLFLLMSGPNHPVTQCHFLEDMTLLQVHTRITGAGRSSYTSSYELRRNTYLAHSTS